MTLNESSIVEMVKDGDHALGNEMLRTAMTDTTEGPLVTERIESDSDMQKRELVSILEQGDLNDGVCAFLKTGFDIVWEKLSKIGIGLSNHTKTKCYRNVLIKHGPPLMKIMAAKHDASKKKSAIIPPIDLGEIEETMRAFLDI